jgi:hypothetical protein
MATSMSNRPAQLAFPLPIRSIRTRVSRLINLIVIAINVIVPVAIRPAQLADWTV